MNILYSCLFGSRLYGTQTPTSDLDWKHVVLPPLDTLLLGNGVKNKERKTNAERNVRNTQDDVDETYIPIQVFARDYYAGQTYALELAWAIDGTHAEQAVVPMFVEFTHELRERFLTSNIKAMMGYAVNQASLYSFKGERLNCVRAVRKLMETADKNGTSPTEKLASLMALSIWKQWFADIAAEYPKYFKLTEYDVGAGQIQPCFTLLEKCLPFTNTLEHTARVLMALEGKYGTRADAASKSVSEQSKADKNKSKQTVDWKATMHALRICNQGVELLSTGRMKFPFEQAYVDKLLSIKRGEVPLEAVTTELNEALDKLKVLEASSLLEPSSQDRRGELDLWLTAWMRRFYNLA